MLIRPQQYDSVFATLRQPHCRQAMLWLIGVLLLAQGLIPIQSHTRYAVSAAGVVVELCTLQGVRQVIVDPLTGDLQMLDDHQGERSAAVDFSLLMAEAVVAHAEVQAGWLALIAVEPPPTVIGIPTPRHSSFASIRAPPSIA